jgi:branched-chain amino acid transport system substrate-binding protein
MRGSFRAMLALVLCGGLACAAHAQKVYGPGVTDTTIKIGQTMPYSGPAASYGVLGRVEVALFEAINEQGGINGRKVTLLSFDDAYSPPKTSEQTRKLVEQEGVLGIFGTQGTPTASAIQKYLAAKKMVFLSPSGASRLNDPANDPYMLPIYTSYRTEARVYGRYIAQTKPDAKVAVLYQNDDFGKDYLSGLKEGLGPKADTMIVKTASYEVTDPTIDSQLVSLKESGADVFVDIATPRAGIQAIRRTHEMGWQPLHIIPYTIASISDVLKPAGLDAATGLISAAVQRDPNDPAWANDPQVLAYRAFMDKRLPGVDPTNLIAILGYIEGNIMAQILRQCGDEITSENIIRQATKLQNYDVPMLLPGVHLDIRPNDYAGIRTMRLQRFDGTRWVGFGDLIGEK